MKFFAAFVALFAACQAHAVYPYASIAHHASVHPVAHHHIPAITQYSSYPAVHLAHAAPVSYAHVAHHAPAAVHVASPLAYAHHGYAHHAYAHHAPLVVAKAEATYTAANRGSVHTAPLPGHAVSQTSINLAPAPGTY